MTKICNQETETVLCRVSLKITMLDSSDQIISLKSSDFGHFILLDGMNSIFFFKSQQRYFYIFGCWLLPEKCIRCSDCPKYFFPPTQTDGALPLHPARTPVVMIVCHGDVMLIGGTAVGR